MTTIGARLKYARELAGLNKAALSQLAGLPSDAHVGMIERSKAGQGTTTRTAAKLAAALGVSVGWLISGEGRVPSRRTIREAVSAAQGKAA
jgi:transcriptional regulator with XRE-family HTH domain